ncbi:S8 family serine peptidase [Haloarcula quadrata]|uniref:S8 family serine peptidase n=1 Tax=Haloarcula quadrata TaxID=182779 RepID=UPI00142D9ADB|nr:S8 family serine peptidase [Haloarcula quadrata]
MSAVERLPWVREVRPAMQPVPADVPGSSDGESLGVKELHQNGVTGDGVKVGVIDSGFDRDNPAIGNNVVTTRSFRSTAGDPAHGTAVAEVVTQTAPDSDLYLVSADTTTDHQRAIEYLANQDVDIIVYSISWPSVEDDGDHYLSDEIVSARQQGTLFVTSAGNEAEHHWEGDFQDTDQDDIHEWTASGDEVNSLPSPGVTFRGGAINAVLRWEERGDPSEYRLALLNPNTAEYVSIGRSRALSTETSRWTTISATVEPQPLALVVQHTGGPADDEIELVVFKGPRRIERTIPSSSVMAPGDVDAAVTVGAYERGKYVQSSGIASYSGRGPTDDGRRGVDVAGYTNTDLNSGFYDIFGGTSAAAPYVGGVAALVEEQQKGDPSPAEVESTLKSTSDDIGRSGADTVSGTGAVDAIDAVGSATTPTPTVTPTPTPTATVAQSGDRVFQGQESIQFGSQDFDTLTGVSGDAEGQVLSTPIPQDQTTGTYSADGTLNTFSVVVGQPRISDYEILNESGKDIAGSSVADVNAENLEVVVEYNFAKYEGIDLTIENPNGLESQGYVVNSPNPVQASGSGTQTVTFDVNLSDEDAGTYAITAEGTDDFDFGKASVSALVTVRETQQDPVERFDANDDGEIDIGELGTAATEFARGEIDVGALGAVAAAFAS